MLKAWLDSRSPAPPEQLAKRLEAATEGARVSESAGTSEALTVAAAAILERLGAGGSDAESRSAALDLLAADALVTYAVEAAAEDCGSFLVTIDGITAQLAGLGAPARDIKASTDDGPMPGLTSP